ncbi:hypothetical protein [Kutzneria sp. NPDC052558]|uniref:hypothetical protein n=1 Tax=Kutzneria sp. NPDC052558 TaxID=3364121 RepID=UPI0037C770E3
MSDVFAAADAVRSAAARVLRPPTGIAVPATDLRFEDPAVALDRALGGLLPEPFEQVEPLVANGSRPTARDAAAGDAQAGRFGRPARGRTAEGRQPSGGMSGHPAERVGPGEATTSRSADGVLERIAGDAERAGGRASARGRAEDGAEPASGADSASGMPGGPVGGAGTTGWPSGVGERSSRPAQGRLDGADWLDDTRQPEAVGAAGEAVEQPQGRHRSAVPRAPGQERNEGLLTQANAARESVRLVRGAASLTSVLETAAGQARAAADDTPAADSRAEPMSAPAIDLDSLADEVAERLREQLEWEFMRSYGTGEMP